jgi:cytosine/adenosine deaminase-related metal-dependent hydrolase
MSRSDVAEDVVTYAARWVVPVEGPPIENGCVVVRGGRIAAVGKRRVAEGAIVDCGDVVLLPGLVNAHVHFEFSDLTSPLGRPAMSFADWIREVIAYRRRGGFDTQAAVARGLAESLPCGVTTLGEIATSAPLDWFDAPPRKNAAGDVTVFLELIGLKSDRVAAAMTRLDEFLKRRDTPNVHRGLSPHAPYTVRPELFETALARADESRLPVAFHLAESPDELELLRDGRGSLVDLLCELDAWDAAAIPRGSRPLDYLRRLATAPRSLVIHGNYLDDEEIAFAASQRERLAVVYCPRTHAYFGHPPHPLPKLLAAGASVALGTDGRSSNPDLDLLADIRQVAMTFPMIVPERIVRLGTIDGACALGRDHDVGSLAVGKRAHLVALRVDRPTDNPYESIPAPTSHVERVVF